MVKVLLYGRTSSRRIAQRLHEDIAFRVLAANNTPDFRTISDFRKDNLEALSGLFLQVLALCRQAGLVKLGHVALDGTKVRANASRHKAMSYGRMKEKEASWRRRSRSCCGVPRRLMRMRTSGTDRAHAAGVVLSGGAVGEDTGGDGGEAEAQAAAEQAEAAGKGHSCLRTKPSATSPHHHARPDDFLQAYNCQAVVDSAHQVIVAAQATNQTSVAMVEEAIRQRRRSAQRGILAHALLLCTGGRTTGCATRSSHRSGPATAQLCRRRLGVGPDAPEAADPGSAALRSKRWNRCSARSSRAEAPWRRSAASGATCSSCSALGRSFAKHRPTGASVPNIVGAVGTVRRTKLLVRQWLHPETLAVAVCTTARQSILRRAARAVLWAPCRSEDTAE